MAKEIKFNIEARDLMKKGVDELANAVKVTKRTQRSYRKEIRRSSYHQRRSKCC